MKNKVISGHTIPVAQAGAAVSGRPYDLGAGFVGVALGDYGAGIEGEYETSGVKEFAKDGSAYTVGELVGYDADTNTVVKSADAAKDFDLGRVVKAADAGASVIEVMVNDRQGPGPSFS
jgi:predicted RecA/RadA family phage recombinase